MGFCKIKKSLQMSFERSNQLREFQPSWRLIQCTDISSLSLSLCAVKSQLLHDNRDDQEAGVSSFVIY